MNVKPFLLAPALNLIDAQRLVRVLCDKCKQQAAIAPELLDRAKKVITEIPDTNADKPKTDNLIFYKPVGCPVCNNLGFKGRIGVFELITITDEMKKMINDNKATELDIETIARKNGTTKIVEDGVIKACQGLTTLDEVFRVTE
jgi:type II secretory ATPase GspE/PulE/Tfp pilus assembly ATPase PilB-like protein